MSRVVVEEASQDPMGSDGSETDPGRRRVWREVEVEREITKRQIVQSITTIVVVVLYMVFTLMRERDSGVVVVDPDDAADDWVE